jgi:hypothetical protein
MEFRVSVSCLEDSQLNRILALFLQDQFEIHFNVFHIKDLSFMV